MVVGAWWRRLFSGNPQGRENLVIMEAAYEATRRAQVFLRGE